MDFDPPGYLELSDFQRLVINILKDQTECLHAIKAAQFHTATHVHEVESSRHLLPSVPSPSQSFPATNSGLPPWSTREWDDEQGWSVAMKGAMKRLMERVKKWRDGLDTTLLFIALFSAIVTAFLLQTLQNLGISPDQQNTQDVLMKLITTVVDIAALNGLSTPEVTPIPPFQAAVSDEISASVWYTSLVTSIVCAALAAFARYQMPDLEDAPEGSTFITKVMKIRQRTALAKFLLSPTLKAVHWTLIGSIALFIGGLIFQLWNTHTGIPSSVLFAASVLDTILASILGVFLVAVTLHAIFFPESPFETAFSQLLRLAFCLLVKAVKAHIPVYRELGRTSTKEKHTPTELPSQWSDQHPRSAAYHFCDLISDCHAPDLLHTAAPVLIRCLDYVNMDGSKSMQKVESAIAHVLAADTSPQVQLMTLINIRRIGRDSLADETKLAPLEKLPPVLLRIQEYNFDRSDETTKRIREEAFQSMIHVLNPPKRAGDSSSSSVIERTYEDCLAIGFSDGGLPSSPVDGDLSNTPVDNSQITLPFRGALLNWNSLGPSRRDSILKRIDVPAFLIGYVRATAWAHQDFDDLLGRDTRARYRTILESLDSKLEEIIEDYAGSNRGNILSRMGDFISNLDEWLDFTRDQPTLEAGKVLLDILDFVRRYQPSWNGTTRVNFELLTRMFPVSPQLSNILSVQMSSTLTFDSQSLRRFEILLFYIRHYQDLLGPERHKRNRLLCQYLVDCNGFLASRNLDFEDPRYDLCVQIRTLSQDALNFIQGMMHARWLS
ncbi:hypothetical protein SISSUDRAFT_1050939 [Sistotremastrum suecicum HHB10207 ss-3]|uniref:DUF6535 domain-containing protein n=1 Tax=Sistotremastrum suecicum HHB10207 ss-3 TaxID=1314776 RepID=A0A166AW52_9AGAM|nr:hypothetical protein SISSUDRAFT_1050939 [Sistotremastrum suecicum HHB10207 ss-3]